MKRLKLNLDDITKCEQKVLLVIIAENEEGEKRLDLMKVRELANTQYDCDWKPQTVSTFLQRLRSKNFLTAKREGRVHLYTPTLTMKEIRLQAIELLKEQFFEGDAKMMEEYFEQYQQCQKGESICQQK